MVLILVAASLLSLALGKLLEAGAIGAIVVLFVLVGFFQEYRAERAIAALREMAVPVVRVVRDGRVAEIPAAELVPGDVVHLEAGSVVPADLRLTQSANLRVQEAALTGESEPVDKTTDALADDDAPLGDRRNLAYSGTQVTYGRGVGVVVATGMGTELGRIAGLLQGVRAERTLLQERLDRVGKQLALAGVVVAVLVTLMGLTAGERWSDLVLTAISVAVAVIPEGLPAVVTFTLAIGAQRMLRRQALIRKLPAVETLGSVTTICSDKTGTLTQNRMSVTVIDVAGRRVPLPSDGTDGAVGLVLAAGALCNDSEVRIAADGHHEMIGDPTETALVLAAESAGIDVTELRRAVPRTGERPFDSDRKRMSTSHDPVRNAAPALAALPQDQPVTFVKGAVDGMLPLLTAVWTDHGPSPIDAQWRERIGVANDDLARAGQRVLGVATRIGSTADDDPERELTLLGLVGMIDPPRPEVRDAVARCRDAGIRPVMITGDHPLTARAIAADLGISDDERVLTGVDLDRLDGPAFDTAAQEVSVFARVAPEHKLRIVESLQRHGQVVAMTGDGVNDAPALKRADIGVAMGITGTDVSKEASDMVLRDDNFATIVAAVEEGRVIYDNLRRFVSFAVAGNLGKVIVMLGWPIPFLLGGLDTTAAVALLPLQLLWLNLMTDGLLGLSIGTEPAESNAMRRPPHRSTDGIWAGGLGRRTAWIGLLIGSFALALGVVYHEAGEAEWQTIIFTSLALLQVGQALGTRSERDSLFSASWRTNRPMLAAVAIVVALQLAALYTPLRHFLDLQPLSVFDLAACAAAGGVLLAVLELAKWRRRRTRPRRTASPTRPMTTHRRTHEPPTAR
jgi:Ca2+-transporting ATPase